MIRQPKAGCKILKRFSRLRVVWWQF